MKLDLSMLVQELAVLPHTPVEHNEVSAYVLTHISRRFGRNTRSCSPIWILALLPRKISTLCAVCCQTKKNG